MHSLVSLYGYVWVGVLLGGSSEWRSDAGQEYTATMEVFRTETRKMMSYNYHFLSLEDGAFDLEQPASWGGKWPQSGADRKGSDVAGSSSVSQNPSYQ